jgi:hypothetical protein
MAENGFDDKTLKNNNMTKIFGVAFILSLIISFVLVLLLGPERDAMTGGFGRVHGWTFLSTPSKNRISNTT